MKWISCLLAAVCLGLSVYIALATQELRQLREQFQVRQNQINQGERYRQLNGELIKALANVSAKAGDEDIRQMLASEGVTFTLNQPAESTIEEEVQVEGQGDE